MLLYVIDVTPRNNVDRFFTAIQCHPSLFGIIKVITCSSGFELYFET